ncbi:MAG: TRAP transporter small permease [Deltaproteobacteria bacterium]|nr:TRAP transporter small permease [Deltaproteobacteria bacterium]
MLEKFDRFFVRANQTLIGVMMLVMFILVFINVLGRYGIGKSWAAAEEISTFLMIWVTYLGAGLALREGRHAAIDMFQDKLPVGLRRPLRVLLGVVILAFFGALAWLGVRMSIFGWSQETIATQMPTGIPYLAIPLGAIMFCMHLVLTFREWVDRRWEEIAMGEADIGLEEKIA